MSITVDLTLDAGERDQLAGILGCTAAQLDNRFVPYVRAAADEYARMFLGQRVFTRGSDMREYRLFLLMRDVFSGIPDEQKVCDLFQTTETQSRSLIRSVMSKYQYELRAVMNDSLKAAVEGAVPDGDDLRLTVRSDNIIDALNRLVESLGGTLAPIERKRGTVSSYVLRQGTAAALRKHFKIKST